MTHAVIVFITLYLNDRVRDNVYMCKLKCDYICKITSKIYSIYRIYILVIFFFWKFNNQKYGLIKSYSQKCLYYAHTLSASK